MCVLDSCCFCIPLRIGAFIIAVVYLVFAIFGQMSYFGVMEGSSELGTVNLVFSIIFLIAAIMLFIGVLFENYCLLQPWIWSMLVILVLYAIATIVLIGMMFSKNSSGGTTNIIGVIILILINLYCLFIVHSYEQTIGYND